MTDPRQRPRKGRKDDPNFGQKEADREQDDPDLGQKEAEEEKAEPEEEGGEKGDELESHNGRRLAIILKWSPLRCECSLWQAIRRNAV
jgi:hypothetical protein